MGGFCVLMNHRREVAADCFGTGWISWVARRSTQIGEWTEPTKGTANEANGEGNLSIQANEAAGGHSPTTDDETD